MSKKTFYPIGRELYERKEMAELPHWENVVAPQKYEETGCIPAGYEWLIRYLDINKVNLNRFQDEFDLERSHRGKNDFNSIAQEIMKKYRFIKIKTRDFPTGLEKLKFILELIERDVPCLLSLAKTKAGGWHMVPVVKIDEKIKVIWLKNSQKNETCEYSAGDIIRRHDEWKGGKDIAWIEK